MGTMRRNETFNQVALPRRILSPIFNSYKQGERYDRHIDAALMGPYPGMRTDLSITIFLNAPDAYEGGELILESLSRTLLQAHAGRRGALSDPFHHRVNPITKGRRLAAVTWIESMVPDPQQREVLADLANAAEILVTKVTPR